MTVFPFLSGFPTPLMGFPKVTSQINNTLSQDLLLGEPNLRQGHSLHPLPNSVQFYPECLELCRRLGSAAGGFSSEHGAKTLHIGSSLPLMTTKLVSGDDLCGQHV